VIDLLLIALVIYYLNRPVNVLLQQEVNDLVYELNVTGIKGKRILIGFTIVNESPENSHSLLTDPVIIRITSKKGDTTTFQKSMDNHTVLSPGESGSTIFLLEERDLPSAGILELFYDSDSKPLFSKNIRF
jgi:hypothetical protein